MESNKLWQLMDGGHGAFADLADPVSHRRRVIFVSSQYWVVIDDLMAAAEHDIEVRYQLAPIAVEQQSDGWVRARGDLGQALLIRNFSTVALNERIERGQEKPLRGWISPRYGQYLAAPALSVRCRAQIASAYSDSALPAG